MYAVSGGIRLFSEVYKSLVSLRKYDKETPVTVVANHIHKDVKFDGLAQTIVIEDLWNTKHHYSGKFKALLKTPYERTIILDSDTYFLQDCTHLFKLLDYFDFSIAKDYLEPWQEIEGYYPYNTGVMVVKKNPKVWNILEKTYRDMEIGFPIKAQFGNNDKKEWIQGDQPVFSKQIALNDIKIYELPIYYNFRPSVPYFLSWSKVKLIHGRGSPEELENIGKKINERIFPRIWFNGEVLYGDYLNFFKKLESGYGRGESRQWIKDGF